MCVPVSWPESASLLADPHSDGAAFLRDDIGEGGCLAAISANSFRGVVGEVWLGHTPRHFFKPENTEATRGGPFWNGEAARAAIPRCCVVGCQKINSSKKQNKNTKTAEMKN